MCVCIYIPIHVSVLNCMYVCKRTDVQMRICFEVFVDSSCVLRTKCVLVLPNASMCLTKHDTKSVINMYMYFSYACVFAR